MFFFCGTDDAIDLKKSNRSFFLFFFFFFIFSGEKDPDFDPNEEQNKKKKKKTTKATKEETKLMLELIAERIEQLEDAQKQETPSFDPFYMKLLPSSLYSYQMDTLDFAARLWQEYVF